MAKHDMPSDVPVKGEPVAGGKGKATFYEIDCEGGVICFEPDEERTSIVNNLVIKNCVWNRTPYQNRGEGRLWISFTKSAESCWQVNQETFEENPSTTLKLPPDVREMRVQ